MYSLSQGFHRAQSERANEPVLLLRLTNAFGVRVYADRTPQAALLGLSGPLTAGGDVLADGSRRAGEGSLNLLDTGAKVLSYGRLRETLTPQSGQIMASLRQEEASSLSVTMSNEGPDDARPMSRIEAMENILGATGELIIGFPGVPAREFMTRFSGRVQSYTLRSGQLRLSLRAA